MMPQYTLASIAVSTMKAGLRPEENEDAWAARGGSWAVADGASEGWDSGLWARTLVQSFTQNPPGPDTFAEWLATTRAHFTPETTRSTQTLAWYAEVKQEQGAFATLVGIALRSTTQGGIRWRAMAVGDSCLFQLRSGNLLTRFPVESPEAFSNAPQLLSTLGNGEPLQPEWLAGTAEPGDEFYLLSDAMAEWFLREYLHGHAPDQQMRTVLSAPTPGPAFAEWVANVRTSKTLKNDDCTMVRIAIDPASEQ